MPFEHRQQRRLSEYRTFASDFRFSKWRDSTWRREFDFTGMADLVMPSRSKFVKRPGHGETRQTRETRHDLCSILGQQRSGT